VKIDLSKLRKLEQQRVQLQALVDSLDQDLTAARLDADAKARALESYFSGGIPCPPEIRKTWHELRFDPEAVLPLAEANNMAGLAASAEAVVAARKLQAEILGELKTARTRLESAAGPLARLNEFVRQNGPTRAHIGSF